MCFYHEIKFAKKKPLPCLILYKKRNTVVEFIYNQQYNEGFYLYILYHLSCMNINPLINISSCGKINDNQTEMLHTSLQNVCGSP